MIVLDFNGLIADTAHAVSTVVNATLTRHGSAAMSLSEVRDAYGYGVRGLVRATIPFSIDEAAFAEACVAEFQATPRLFEGAREFLRSVDQPLVLLSNSPALVIDRLVDAAGLSGCFDFVVGDAQKPVPKVLLEALASVGASRADIAVVIGDQSTDFGLARRIDVPSIGARWGYGNQRDDPQPDRWVDDFDDLFNALRELTQTRSHPVPVKAGRNAATLRPGVIHRPAGDRADHLTTTVSAKHGPGTQPAHGKESCRWPDRPTIPIA